ncbi:hypothetical protein KBI23_20515, partial [bacterium]|nr:hypothetical protein [bacterium]MBP9811466.1 hypothetical protein [bacterium]
MRILSKFTMAFASLAVVGTLSIAAPALAQDAFGSGNQDTQNSMGATGTQARENYTTGSQTQHVTDGS